MSEPQSVPTVKAVRSEEIRHEDGRVDVVIHVPRLGIKNVLMKQHGKTDAEAEAILKRINPEGGA